MCVGIVFATSGAAFSLASTTAVANVPYVQIQGTGDNYARASTEIGSIVYVGGTFSTVFEPLSGTNFKRANLYAYDEGTKRVTSFAPSFDGEVWGLAHSPDGRFLYVAGNFSNVNGVARRGLARFDLTTGALTSFNAHLNGQARTVNYVGGHLIVGGSFTTVGGVGRVALASLDPTTGALQPSYLNAGLAGTVSSTAGATAVYHSAVNPAGTQMAVSGNFTSAGGATHWRVILLALGSASATVSGWNAPILQQPCNSVGIPNYVSGLSYAADGSWFALAATGARNETNGFPLSQTICDAVSRWSATAAGNVAPTWVNYTGCDSLYSVLVAPDAVYVGGHNRWLDNPNACNEAGTGAVSRPGIGAVDPTTGRALSWDPTRSRGRGAVFLELTRLGLTVLSDCAAPGNSSDPSSGSNFLAQTFHPCVGVLGTPTPTTETLSVSKTGSGSGTVTSSPAGISCGSTCSHDFTSGTSVTLTATPATGSSFSGWSGACTGTGTCTVTMNQAESVTAGFALRSEALSVSHTGSGGGAVVSSPAGISCGSTCSHGFTFGTSVTLTAMPATGSTFSGWSGACTGTGTCTVTMNQAESVTAGFALRSETLRVSATGTGSGTVVSRPAGISCGSTCSHGFAYGTRVTLTATPKAGSTFGGWSGACTGTGTCTLTTDRSQSATATFVQELRGPKLRACIVPKLKGKTLKAAKRALRKAHCRAGEISHRFSRHKKGRVISQRPRPRRHLRNGAKVKLVVSKGRRH
ncbi:MAG TPA: PASTA domain-containing protein [Gaiellaceae bacterium]|nr:PASTA domain-containing protein [Gaiellaceae bacterium]